MTRKPTDVSLSRVSFTSFVYGDTCTRLSLRERRARFKGEDRDKWDVCEKKRENIVEKLLERSFSDRLIPARRLALSQSGKNVKRENVIVKNEGDSSRAPGPFGIFTALFTCGPHIENADLPEVGTRL